MLKTKLSRGVGLALLGIAAALALVSPAFAQGGMAGGEANPESTPPIGQHVSLSAFTGAPAITDGLVRYWVWNENVGGQNILHLRTTTDGATHSFGGVINTSGRGNFYELALANATNGDDTTTNVSYNQFTFALVNNGSAQEGFDVKWSGRWLSLDLFIDGYARPKRVLYGANAKRSRKHPLIVNAGEQGFLTLPLTALDGTTQFQKNIADGYFLYRDTNGAYHLRLTTTSENDYKDYAGRLRVDQGAFTAIKIFRGDPRDYYTLTGGTDLQFRFHTKGYEDGLDWRLTRNSGMTVTLRMNRALAAPNVWLGSMDPHQPGIPAYTIRLVP